MSRQSPENGKPHPKRTVTTLKRMKSRGDRIAMLTAYDYTTARILDDAGVDVLLVGDSLGMVMLGYDTTLPVTMDEMVHHTRAVARATRTALVVADMPFMSYQASEAEAMTNAGRLLKEGLAEAVKLEGGSEHVPLITRLTRAGIPVMAHLGLTPQSVHQLGGYRVQGRDEADARHIVEESQRLEEAGAFALVLECVPQNLAKEISTRLAIPVIGIGAGAGCDGQVLVTQDMLGLYQELSPRHVKRYADLHGQVTRAVTDYIQEVRDGAFPSAEQSFEMDEEAAQRLEDEWARQRSGG